MKKILIANRGEIAIRISHAIEELGFESVAVYSRDDANSLHIVSASSAVELPASGSPAYLDIESLLGIARDTGCDAIHPGYGFLSESASFAQSASECGLIFIGPAAATLEQLGDKVRARQLAVDLGVPVIEGLPADSTVAETLAFMQQLNGEPIVVKAVAGGGGRGMRVVEAPEQLASSLQSARAEALSAFGVDDVFVERYLRHTRHIEVQIIGDGRDVAHIWERDCSLQRRHQKLVEIAPAPALPAHIRDQLLDYSVQMAAAVSYSGLGTFEFLLSADNTPFFIEANPRLQVEHTVTEAVTGIDLVKAQIQIAAGASLDALGLVQRQIPETRGTAVQARVNLEKIIATGETQPTSGVVGSYEPPGGPGVRVDGHGYPGLHTSVSFDSLLAKVVCHAQTVEAAVARCKRALRSFRIDGVETNIPFLQVLLQAPEIPCGTTHTRLIEENAQTLAEQAGKYIAVDFPLIALAESQHQDATQHKEEKPGALLATIDGSVVSVDITVGEAVAKGQSLIVIEAMKMQHAIRAAEASVVRRVLAASGDRVTAGEVLAELEPVSDTGESVPDARPVDLDRVRDDLAELQQRRAFTRDSMRPEAVAKRHGLGKRTARENIEHLCDPDSFVEYGDLVVAAQRSRRSIEDLIKNTPADGLVTGFGSVNAEHYGAGSSRCAVMAYDYTVLAGTQGLMNHIKTDRMIDVIRRQRTPVIFFCEGGGGRPGDVDAGDTSIAGLYCTTFFHYAQLSGLVPLIGIGSGRLFAGNAALLGCCDVIIATRDSSIGMGGPAMIEGGGLGVFRPEEVGPSAVQAGNGVIDILVDDEKEAVDIAKKYLAYFQGPVSDWQQPDARLLRHVVPENRLEVYDVHDAIEGIADVGSVLELRAGYAPGMVTALMRVSGRTVGVVANNPMHLSGAIDSPAADKAARFLKLCDSFDLPVLMLCDTPGMMVGPDIEKTALVRHCSRLFLVGGNLEVPVFTIILRKAYGLGAQAMAGGSFRTPVFTIGWPTAEIGGMGLEGAVKLGYRKELEAVEDQQERRALFDKMVAESYQRGKAINAASILEFDTVIDPAESRQWIISALDAIPDIPVRQGKKRAYVDSW